MKFNSQITSSTMLILILSCAAHNLAVADDSYRVKFETSCALEVQDNFNLGITNLHSFEYIETARIFGEIIEQDPGCAMAYWGAAMSIWHPLWAPPSQGELERGAELLATTDNLAMTPREAGYLNALKAFFSSNDTSTHFARAGEFEAGMSKVYANNLDDPEAAAFYALALLASSSPKDKTYAHQYKAGGILNWIRDSQPIHPGVLHYTIHSYDFPGLAHLALPSALIYADSAPNSAHAQHMPSHIFTRLGMWDKSLASNHDSTRSAADYTEKAHLPGHYDEGLHSMDYLMYAMLQTARDDEALALLESLRRIKRTDTENFKVAYTYASSSARYVLERRDWSEASQLPLVRPDNFDWSEFPWALSIHHFARGLGAARSNQLEKAYEELSEIVALQESMSPATLPYWLEETQVQIDTLSAWIAYMDGNKDSAMQLAASAADREDAVDKHPVTPGEVIPARESYAEMLLLNGDYEGALHNYEAVLGSSPRRLNAMLGAMKAATALQKKELATDYESQVREQVVDGRSNRLDLNRLLSGR